MSSSASSTKAWQRALRGVVAFLALGFCVAPVPGDAGGCSQQAQELDASAFFASKQYIDCERCTACRIESEPCDRACGSEAPESEFPEGCRALVHDGEVCLRALLATPCDDYSEYMRASAATTASECNFCPRSPR
jgi:hypothetical protein